MKTEVSIEGKKYFVFLNKPRKEMKKFPTKPEINCYNCDPLGKKYHAAVISPSNGSPYRFCKSCLTNMINGIDKAIVEQIKDEGGINDYEL